MPEPVPAESGLNRALSRSLLLLYGLGTILGAGIYVLTGVVAEQAGILAPLSFLLAAVVALPTAVSYARLAARYPQSAGEAVYVMEAFNRQTLANFVGASVVIIGIVSAATLLRGFVGYVQVFIDVPAPLIILLTSVVLALFAIWGVVASVGFAAFITIAEILGLLLVISGGLLDPVLLVDQILALPASGDIAWPGVFAGAFIAFYAFIGFEDIVNMAEETRQPAVSIPFAIFGSLAIASCLYFLVVLISIATVPIEQIAGNEAPMAAVVAHHGLIDPRTISLISLLAIINGALIQIVMSSRVIYGVARINNRSPFLQAVNPRTQTPLNATLLVTLTILVLALSLDLTRLASLTSALTLLVFLLINLAWIKLSVKRFDRLIAVAGACLCLLLAAVTLI